MLYPALINVEPALACAEEEPRLVDPGTTPQSTPPTGALLALNVSLSV